MCGIVGIVSWEHDRSLITKTPVMADMLAHRGPDDFGFLFVDAEHDQVIDGFPKEKTHRVTKRELSLALGHRRLSILDLSPRGHQPMSRGRDLWLVHNGEIYNYIELRQQLAALGHEFSSGTDTEVILAAYQEWGPDCVSRFNGMWGFVILDLARNRLFCSRDRMGIKPFYYVETPAGFAFASEIKALLEVPGVSRVIDRDMVFDMAIPGYTDHATHTPFRDVRELRGGCNLLIDIPAKRIEHQTWWSAAGIEVRDVGDVETEISALTELFDSAVGLRLRSDVPIAFSLSGGVDSSLLATFLGEQRERQPLALTSHLPEHDEVDETGFAAKVTRHLGLNHKLVKADGTDVRDLLMKMVWHTELPFGSLSSIMLWTLYTQTRALGFPVMLSGQGGDELFFGYDRYHPLMARNLLGRMRPLEAAMTVRKGAYTTRLPAGRLLGLAAYYGSPTLRSMALNRRYSSYFNSSFLNFGQARRRISQITPPSDMNGMQVLELAHTNLPGLLRLDDRVSMALSMETRLPFLDYRIVEKALSYPADFKLRDGWAKWPLRRILDGRLPDSIAWRRGKYGFNPPQAAWMADLEPMIRETFAGETSLEPILQGDKVRAMVRDGQLPAAQLWRLFSLECWMKAFDLSVE